MSNAELTLSFYQVSYDHRSYERNLSNCVSLKKSGLQRGLNPVEIFHISLYLFSYILALVFFYFIIFFAAFSIVIVFS